MMLIDFTVSNFKSIGEKITFSMVPSPTLKTKKNRISNNTGILKSAVIFGANASGKSNLIDAIRTVKNIVCGDTPAAKDIICKLNSKYASENPRFELSFYCDNAEKEYFRYIVELDIQHDHLGLNGEVLIRWDPAKEGEEVIFETNSKLLKLSKEGKIHWHNIDKLDEEAHIIEQKKKDILSKLQKIESEINNYRSYNQHVKDEHETLSFIKDNALRGRDDFDIDLDYIEKIQDFLEIAGRMMPKVSNGRWKDKVSFRELIDSGEPRDRIILEPIASSLNIKTKI